MIRALAPVAALLLSVALLLAGNGLQNTLAPVRASLEGFTPLALGGLGAAYYIGFGLGCFFGPSLVRRAGHIRTFAAMVAIASAAALIHPLFIDPTVWQSMRFVTGICFAVLFMVIESWLNEKATNETRGVVFSVYIVVNLGMVSLGQLLVTLDDPKAFSLFALASILVSVAAVPLAMTKSEQPSPPANVRVRLVKLYKLSPVGVIGVLAVVLTNGPFWSLGPVFAEKAGGSAQAAAIFMAIGALAGAIGQWPLGRTSDKMDRRRVIIFASFGSILGGVGAAVFGDTSEAARLASVFVFGAFALPLYALSAAHMNDMVEQDGFVEAAGGLLLTFAIGAAIGPMLASAATSAWGQSSLFLFTASIHVLLICFTVYRMTRNESVSEEERGEFANASVMAQTVATIESIAEDNDEEPVTQEKPPA